MPTRATSNRAPDDTSLIDEVRKSGFIAKLYGRAEK